MSRIGKQPIPIPSKVKVAIDGRNVKVEGPNGKLQQEMPAPIAIAQEDKQIVVTRPNDEKKNKALHGLVRALINNMVVGCSEGFERVLEINGVGYRADAQGKKLVMELGYSHPIEYPLPDGISAEVERNVIIKLKGADKELLGRAAAKIRSFRPPEPYKGKGVKYAGEYIQRKVGKKNM
jgi:large subunit ribosomal protein L6